MENRNSENQFTIVLIVVAILQFFTWFKPSEPFFTPFVLEQFNITEKTLISDIYAYDVVFQLLSGVVVGLSFWIFGHQGAFLICSASSIASVSCVLFSSSQWVLLMSQAFWALSFSALYVLLIALLQLFPRKLFQKAVSINSFSMLVSSTISGFTGFMLLQFSPAVKDQHGRRITFFVTFASVIVAFAVLCFSVSPCINIFSRKIPKTKSVPKENRKCHSHLLRIKQMLVNLNLVAWLVLSSIMRGIHTEVLTLWQILAEEIDVTGTQSKYNGIISMVAYILAAILVLLPIKLESLIVRHLWWLSPTVLALAMAALVCLSQSQAIASLGVFYVFFHALAETFLAVATAQMAKAAYTDQISDSDYGQTFVILLSAKYMLSLLVEVVVQLVIWPHWGIYHNIFKFDFDIRQQILGLGSCIAFAFILAVLLGVRMFFQQRTQREVEKSTTNEKLLGDTTL